MFIGELSCKKHDDTDEQQSLMNGTAWHVDQLYSAKVLQIDNRRDEKGTRVFDNETRKLMSRAIEQSCDVSSALPHMNQRENAGFARLCSPDIILDVDLVKKRVPDAINIKTAMYGDKENTQLRMWFRFMLTAIIVRGLQWARNSSSSNCDLSFRTAMETTWLYLEQHDTGNLQPPATPSRAVHIYNTVRSPDDGEDGDFRWHALLIALCHDYIVLYRNILCNKRTDAHLMTLASYLNNNEDVLKFAGLRASEYVNNTVVFVGDSLNMVMYMLEHGLAKSMFDRPLRNFLTEHKGSFLWSTVYIGPKHVNERLLKQRLVDMGLNSITLKRWNTLQNRITAGALLYCVFLADVPSMDLLVIVAGSGCIQQAFVINAYDVGYTRRGTFLVCEGQEVWEKVHRYCIYIRAQDILSSTSDYIEQISRIATGLCVPTASVPQDDAFLERLVDALYSPEALLAWYMNTYAAYHQKTVSVQHVPVQLYDCCIPSSIVLSDTNEFGLSKRLLQLFVDVSILYSSTK